MSRKHRNHKLARFEDFDTHRAQAGLDDLDQMAELLGGRGPRKRSLERLSAGRSIRLTSAYRAGHLINKYLSRNGLSPIQLNQSIVRTDNPAGI